MTAAWLLLIMGVCALGVVWGLCLIDRAFHAVNNGREQKVIRRVTSYRKGHN